ncbi:F0F1 ATP synthase subunit B [Xanthobacter dioxanivorans]|uniref:ATP synthase subunit b n=2 Tax=Xanthobacter dioxanivorans TaxID=2528964 RepID=A0A974PTH9_9HYPH|nr:F0F1 ATP synthase subunit B [Xanthobacter dioxanivorans]
MTGAVLLAAPLSAASDPAAPATLVAQAAQGDHAQPSHGQGTHEGAPGAAAGHAEEGHGKKSHFPPFDGTTFASQLLWLVLSFGLLYLLMSRIALPRIGRILEERHDRIADDLEEAAKHKAESEAAQASYEKALAEARAKANSIAGETRNRLAADSDANRKALEAELADKLAAAEQRIASTKTEALTHVKGIAVDATNTIVNTLIGTTPATADVEQAVDGALARKDAA